MAQTKSDGWGESVDEKKKKEPKSRIQSPGATAEIDPRQSTVPVPSTSSDIITDDIDSVDGGVDANIALIKKAVSGDVDPGELPSEKKLITEPDKKRAAAMKKNKEESKKESEKIAALPMTKLERTEEATKLLKAEMELVKTKQEAKRLRTALIEDEVSNLAQIKYVTDPRKDPMINYEAKVGEARSKLKEAMEEGVADIQGAMPSRPVLHSEEVNSNQAMITLAMQSITGLMGSLSGSDAGFRASAVAASKGAIEMEKNVMARKKANADIMKIYHDSAGKGLKAVGDLAKTYLTQVGGLEKEALKDYTNHWNNIETIKNKNDIYQLSEATAKMEQLVASGKITADQRDQNIKSLQERQEHIMTYEGLRQEAFRNRTTAEKAALVASMKGLELHLKQLKSKGVTVLGDKNMMLTTPEYRLNVAEVNRITAGPSGMRNWERSLRQNTQLSNDLASFDVMYSTTTLTDDPGLLKRSEKITSNLNFLAKSIMQTGEVPISVDINKIDQIDPATWRGAVHFSKHGVVMLPSATKAQAVAAAHVIYAKVGLLKEQAATARRYLAGIEQKKGAMQVKARAAYRAKMMDKYHADETDVKEAMERYDAVN